MQATVKNLCKDKRFKGGRVVRRVMGRVVVMGCNKYWLVVGGGVIRNWCWVYKSGCWMYKGGCIKVQLYFDVFQF